MDKRSDQENNNYHKSMAVLMEVSREKGLTVCRILSIDHPISLESTPFVAAKISHRNYS